MNLDDLLRSAGEWLRGDGAMNDVVLSSRIRLARNLAGHSFLSAASSTERTEIYRQLSNEVLDTLPTREAILIDLTRASELERQLLVERHLISRQQAADQGSRGVAVTPSETIALMINEEDHLRVQGLRSGMQLESLWAEVDHLDDALGTRLDFAFDQRFGYLTACPTNVGTGIRVSVMLHLPAMKMAQELDKLSRGARDMKLAVRGLYGEGTDAHGDLYQVSNQTTLGRSEQQIVERFATEIIPQIVEWERAARQHLVKHRSVQLDDLIWRAFGLLSHARRISSDETIQLLSPIRMGIHLGRFDRIDLAALNEIFLLTQPAHLQHRAGRSLDGEERSIARAQFIHERITP